MKLQIYSENEYDIQYSQIEIFLEHWNNRITNIYRNNYIFNAMVYIPIGS